MKCVIDATKPTGPRDFWHNVVHVDWTHYEDALKLLGIDMYKDQSAHGFRSPLECTRLVSSCLWASSKFSTRAHLEPLFVDM